jgi:hypothetical protein
MFWLLSEGARNLLTKHQVLELPFLISCRRLMLGAFTVCSHLISQFLESVTSRILFIVSGFSEVSSIAECRSDAMIVVDSPVVEFGSSRPKTGNRECPVLTTLRVLGL